MILQFRVANSTQEDAQAIADLLTELGHTNSTENILSRWEEWSAVPYNQVLLAMTSANQIIGLAVTGRSLSLYRPYPIGRIWAFIITSEYRGKGLGRIFLQKIEHDFIAAGCGMVELTRNTVRRDAHRFYEQQGYEKSSYRFVKGLGGLKMKS